MGAGHVWTPRALRFVAASRPIIMCPCVRSLIESQSVLCGCRKCSATQRSLGYTEPITPTEFERHSGLINAKKWRTSIKVDLPLAEEVDPNGEGLAIGRCALHAAHSLAAGRQGLVNWGSEPLAPRTCDAGVGARPLAPH